MKFGYADNVDEIGIIVKSAKTSNLAKLMANEEFRNTILSQNPNAQILMNQMQQSGMSMRDFTLQYAKQNNINLEPIIQQLNQRGIKL